MVQIKFQPDFLTQKSLVQEIWQEVVEAAGHRYIFLPKFHCELNFIEFFCQWGALGGAVKKYLLDNCDYTSTHTREHVSKTWNNLSVEASDVSLDGCVSDTLRTRDSSGIIAGPGSSTQLNTNLIIVSQKSYSLPRGRLIYNTWPQRQNESMQIYYLHQFWGGKNPLEGLSVYPKGVFLLKG